MINDLALILIVASVVTLLFKWLKQPLVLGYIVAGFLVSPNMPYTASVTQTANIHVWSDIGVMFLLFALGLEFSFKKILKMGMAPVIAVITIIFLMMMSGIWVGHLFGWSRMDCIFLGGMLCMSSTTIIYKAFDDLGLREQHFASLVMSVLIMEDILAIVMMVMLSAIAKGSLGGEMMLESALSIVFFLVLWFMVGLFFLPWALRKTRKLMTPETLVVLSLGLCCAMAVISTKVGFSSAFGAFVMGSILAETVEAEKISKLVEPVKNLFGAIFFVSVGMLVEPRILVEYAWPILGLVLTILVGQALFGSFGFLLSGQTMKNAMRCGFSMAQIGEFAFIIASLGLSLRVISDFLYPVVVAVSVVTTFLTPYMMRAAEPSYEFLERHMSKRAIRRINHFGMAFDHAPSENNLWRSLLTHMLTNTIVFSILSVTGIVLMLDLFLPFCRSILPHWWANGLCGISTILLISPFLRAIIAKNNHSEEFKKLWTQSRLNRPPLVFTILVRIIIAASFVCYIVNYLSRFTHAFMITLALVMVGYMYFSRRIKKSSIQMERMFIQNLRSREIAAQVAGHRRPLYEGRLLDRAIHISEIIIPADSKWAGRSLAELGLGNRFGVHVSSIARGHQHYNIPGGEAIIFPLDRLQVIGSDDQLAMLANAAKSEIIPEEYDIENREMKLRQIIISEDSPLIGKSLSDSGLRENYGCMLVGIEQGQEHLTQVDPSHVFSVGDILWVVGEKNSELF